MTLRIDYESGAFPPSCRVKSGTGTLKTSWSKLLWAAITVGKPNKWYILEHGLVSVFHTVSRLCHIRMALVRGSDGYLSRRAALKLVDPDGKRMVSHDLGITLCKLFASECLRTPWLLNLNAFHPKLNPQYKGSRRPDFVGKERIGCRSRVVRPIWHVFESKGRSDTPSPKEREKAKEQADSLVSVNHVPCVLHVGSFAYFKSEKLHFYWFDPEPEGEEFIELPDPDTEWQHYYGPALQLARDTEALSSILDIKVEIHPEIRSLLDEKEWKEAHEEAEQRYEIFLESGYQGDGLRVITGPSWDDRGDEGADRLE